LKQSLLSEAASKVFRKSGTPIEGVLFLHTGRYIFLWKDSRAFVVPNAEVEMIETPVSPAKAVTPSQMSPTPTPK
jgi:hypothetical protein